MDPIARQILNTLKCPLCQSQIDFYIVNNSHNMYRYNFGCVVDWQHYRFKFDYSDILFKIEYETVMVYDNNYLYNITQYCDNRTEIVINTVDAEHRIIDNKKKILFNYDKRLFDFTKTNQEKIINRIKTILVFQ